MSSAPAAAVPNTLQAFPCLFLCHGGGPMPLDPSDTMHATLKQAWYDMAKRIYSFSLASSPPQQQSTTTTTTPQRKGPRAIICISAHYQARADNTIHIGSKEKGSLLYDYGGFPEWSYNLQFPNPGHPGIADLAQKAILKALPNIKVNLDTQRGYDHGVFVPILSMLRTAQQKGDDELVSLLGSTPIVPISLLRDSNDVLGHVAIGKALAALQKDEGVWIVGSGSLAHNMRMLMGTMGGRVDVKQHLMGSTFQDKLHEVLTGAGAGGEENGVVDHRVQQLAQWDRWPNAQECQLVEACEHFTPLFSCFGAGAVGDGRVAVRAARATMGVWAQDNYWFGAKEDVDKLIGLAI